jgi:hypothetical protein
MTDDLDRELADLLDERRSANPRRTPEREPLGTPVARRLLWLTVLSMLLATAVMVAVLTSS